MIFNKLSLKNVTSFFGMSLISLFLTACGSDKIVEIKEDSSSSENVISITKEQFQTAKIQFGKISNQSINGTVEVSGKLDLPPQNLITISTPFAGYLKYTELVPGMRVFKGQKIATIEHPDFIQVQQDYLDFKAQLEYLKDDYDRQTDLAKDNINAQKTLQKSKSDYESMKARFSGIAKRIELMNLSKQNLEAGNIQTVISIFAPATAYVTQVNANLGAYISPSDVIFKLADTKHVHAEIKVFESDLASLKIGQNVKFTLANESRERAATVYLIGREINEDRTVSVHCHLDKEDPELLPGTYLKASIQSEIKNGIVVPKTAVIEFQGASYIFVKESFPENLKSNKPHHFSMIQVNTGTSDENNIQLLEDAKFDFTKAEIVFVGAYDLLSAMKNMEEE